MAKASPSESRKISEPIFSELKNLDPAREDLGALLSFAKTSFEEVKHLTEYEDEKANRILTATAFLSALAGAIFVALLPKDDNGSLMNYQMWSWTLWLFYSVFGLFCLLVVSGASFIIWSVRPRFNVPHDWSKGSPPKSADLKNPASFLFFPKIIEATPRGWAAAFCDNCSNQLQLLYIKHYIHEAYLIAYKIRIKLQTLQLGVFMLWLSTIVFVLWIVICGLMFVFPETL
ncbi:MAG: hypothetical protein C4520_02880 [Candidatus Abyssobacteria bacterium SURF_5]|uniref:Pycsar effector protein domain-containing protein n=1 Tax=Abyssobacteria bacterium (strain SURF_5) TaxID=2093360 RepID=A0A3A4NX95_ABYX5|nr:MAG: hypothetical protein C4520_02880 [Candidatus Abyssubacteria bacterium SURF_5]